MTTWHDKMFEEGVVFYISGIFFDIFTNPFFAYPMFFVVSVIVFFSILVLLLNTPIIAFTIKENSKLLKASAYYYVIPKINFIGYTFIELKSNFRRFGWRQWIIIGIVCVVLAGLVTFGLITLFSILGESQQQLINESSTVINQTINQTIINN